MTEVQERKECQDALQKARNYANDANRAWAKIFIDRARVFGTVTARQARYVEMLYEKAAKKRRME